MKPYLLFLLMSLVGYCGDTGTTKKEIVMHKEIAHAANHYEKIEMCYWDIDGTKKLQLSREDTIKIADILKQATYKKPVLPANPKPRAYMVYLEITIDKEHPLPGYDDTDISEELKNELKIISFVGLNNKGDIPATNTTFDIPEESKEQFRKILKPYLDQLLPKEHK